MSYVCTDACVRDRPMSAADNDSESQWIFAVFAPLGFVSLVLSVFLLLGSCTYSRRHRTSRNAGFLDIFFVNSDSALLQRKIFYICSYVKRDLRELNENLVIRVACHIKIRKRQDLSQFLYREGLNYCFLINIRNFRMQFCILSYLRKCKLYASRLVLFFIG